MTVRAILDSKGHQILNVEPDAKLSAAVKILGERKIGAVLVMNQGHLEGILSERDIVRGLGLHGEDLLSRPVTQIMTRDVITCQPADTVGALMSEMTNRRIRHLPVVANGRLRGIVSIGDVVKNRLDEVEFEASSLRSFIAGG